MKSAVYILTVLTILSSFSQGVIFGQDETSPKLPAVPTAQQPSSLQPAPQPSTFQDAWRKSDPALDFSRRLISLENAPSPNGAIWPLQPAVIPSNPMTPERFARIVEEMNIMAHIFNKKLAEAFPNDYPRWEGTLSGPRTTAFGTRWIYLEGYGVTFMTMVQFPLKPPPAMEKENIEEPDDAVWRRTKQEIYGTGKKAWDYDADTVEKLKTTLLETLKHATNIESLAPDDDLSIAIFGISPRDMNLTHPSHIVSDMFFPNFQTPYGSTPNQLSSRNVGPPAVTTLTIYVKKSDVDDFALQQLTPATFRQKVHIFAY